MFSFKLPKLSKPQLVHAATVAVGTYAAAFVASLLASGFDVHHIVDLAIYQKAAAAGYTALVGLAGAVLNSWLGALTKLRRLAYRVLRARAVRAVQRRHPSERRLGKLAPRSDARTLWFHHYSHDLPTPAASLSWTTKLPSWLGMMLNDRLGNCTCAAVGHAVQLLTSLASTIITLADTAILTAYEAVSGYDPATGANDNGAVELDVLNYWRKQGVGGHKITGFVKVDHRNLVHLKQAIALFGFAYIGTMVPAAWEQGPDVWDVATGPAGQIVGGHAVILVGWDDKYLTLISWGRTYRMTWAAYSAYVDEAWAVLSPDWIEQDGKSPSGFATKTLLSDLTALSRLS